MVLNKRKKPSPFTKDVGKRDPDYNPEIVVYKREDAADQFIETLQTQASVIYIHYINYPKPMIPLTIDEANRCVWIESEITVIF